MASNQYFRAVERRPIALQARISQRGQQRAFPTQVVNLGLGGAGLELQEALPSGTLVELQIETPYLWDPLDLNARVIWTRTEIAQRNRAGLRFDENAGPSLLALVELLGTDRFGG